MDNKKEFEELVNDLVDPVDSKVVMKAVEDHPKLIATLTRLIKSAANHAQDAQVDMAKTISEDIERIRQTIENGGWNYTTVLDEQDTVRFCYTTGLMDLAGIEVMVTPDVKMEEDVFRERVDAVTHLMGISHGLYVEQENIPAIQKAAGDFEVDTTTVLQLVEDGCAHIVNFYPADKTNTAPGYRIALK
tara:strand:- start:54011 stop:54577 length:567 start_codon:yes stop_codon:yes gene_type:complete